MRLQKHSPLFSNQFPIRSSNLRLSTVRWFLAAKSWSGSIRAPPEVALVLQYAGRYTLPHLELY